MFTCKISYFPRNEECFLQINGYICIRPHATQAATESMEEKFTAEDEKFMRLAINEARKALNEGEVPVGAVVVCNGAVVGRGHNLVETLCDATAHAELQAITAASSTLGGKYLETCTLYVTLEPCVMCAGAMSWSQLGRLVYGAADPRRGYTSVGGQILHPKTAVASGLLAAECEDMVKGFFARLRQ